MGTERLKIYSLGTNNFAGHEGVESFQFCL